MKTKAYSKENLAPELQESIIVFIDILGFKKIVQDSEKDGNSKERFINFYNAFSTSLEIIIQNYGESSSDDYAIRIFTDCIVIGCPIKEERRWGIRGFDEFEFILTILHHFQLDLINKGYFIRGAITVDEFYMDEVVTYGNGLIEAYNAELKLAKFPRIILTKSAESLLININEMLISQDGHSSMRQDLRRDSDGQLFLNYLESIKIGDDDFVENLEDHKLEIEKNIKRYIDEPNILEKYVWSANYHNYFCNQPPYYYEYTIDLTNFQIRKLEF